MEFLKQACIYLSACAIEEMGNIAQLFSKAYSKKNTKNHHRNAMPTLTQRIQLQELALPNMASNVHYPS